MACEKCKHIANAIQCQGCADEICDDCNNGNCDGDGLIAYGSVNGHHIPQIDIKPLNDTCTPGMCVCTDENGDYVKACYLN